MGRTAPHRITPNDATLNVDTTAPNGSVLPEPPEGTFGSPVSAVTMSMSC
jgi:hypothetical protein